MNKITLENFPNTRLRRNRQAPWIRDLTAQITISPKDLILPLFVIEGKNQREEISSLPGVFRLSIDLLAQKAKEARSLGIPALMLFPVTEQKLKNAKGDEALNPKNLICRAVAEIKNAVPEIGVICDVALDPYTSHGQDGLVDEKGYVLNDETVEVLCKQALLQASVGCDALAPSDMMDGRIGAIRQALEQNGFKNTLLISYAAKFASNFYGPFRDAVGSAGNLKADKKTYQMDFRNSSEAMREISMDVAEGADAIIVKPGLPYLDVVKEASQNFSLPIFSYQVSGEYAALAFAAKNGALDFMETMLESVIACKRAGASGVITYAACEIAKKIS